ncbi:hypothetical protein OG455_37995 [Kitasatospora sp. NBC_01287]|uniref:hypothetical protein n=1 Tax=Kitasatospora sp. NBC_01287 TaxID=2903573 RepID=UPI002251B9DC|nr:hypothetical protein [Kitasatospora sp. NBC_01287]MCX4751230.1 hypothetical protein [Kitasatospora sp. NBC_01287]
MTDRLGRRPTGLAACCCLAALGAAIAILAATHDAYTVAALGLFATGGGALSAYRLARAADIRTNQLVLQRLRQAPALGTDALAAELAHRPAAVRLSVHRLTASGRLPAPAGPAESEH